MCDLRCKKQRYCIDKNHNQHTQKSISECKTHPTLQNLGYSHRTPHQVPLMSIHNIKRRLRFTDSPKMDNTKIENVAWSDEFQFLLYNSDGRVRIRCKQHHSIELSCLKSTAQGAGGAVNHVGDIFLARFSSLNTK